MKNYIVKAVINFNDVEEKTPEGLDTPRYAEKSIWNCTKKRYLYLKEHNAVILMCIENQEIPKIENIDEALERIQESAKEEVKRTRKTIKK